jgi:hypothetical protein
LFLLDFMIRYVRDVGVAGSNPVTPKLREAGQNKIQADACAWATARYQFPKRITKSSASE